MSERCVKISKSWCLLRTYSQDLLSELARAPVGADKWHQCMFILKLKKKTSVLGQASFPLKGSKFPYSKWRFALWRYIAQIRQGLQRARVTPASRTRLSWERPAFKPKQPPLTALQRKVRIRSGKLRNKGEMSILETNHPYDFEHAATGCLKVGFAENISKERNANHIHPKSIFQN